MIPSPSNLMVRPRRAARFASTCRRSAASVLVVVLWITAGLTALVLYFAASMGLELRASANRAADLAAGQAIEGAIRYVGWALANVSLAPVVSAKSPTKGPLIGPPTI